MPQQRTALDRAQPLREPERPVCTGCGRECRHRDNVDLEQWVDRPPGFPEDVPLREVVLVNQRVGGRQRLYQLHHCKYCKAAQNVVPVAGDSVAGTTEKGRYNPAKQGVPYPFSQAGSCDKNMSTADKRIPVTEERWAELHELKQPGQTFDELLDELIQEYKRANLAAMVRERREDGEFVEIEDVDEW